MKSQDTRRLRIRYQSKEQDMTRNEYTLDDDGACGFSRVRDWTRFEDIHNQSKEQEMKSQDTRPTGGILFYGNDDDRTEILRIARDGIWANPDIPADDAAKLVLGALDRYIKELVKRVVEDEREAHAKLHEPQEPVAWINAARDVLTSHPESWGREDEDWQALYTHPTPQRQPLTDEQIIGLVRDMSIEMRWPSTPLDIARAIERAHGITGETK